MIPIDGNTTALLQVKDAGTYNAIGERVHTWTDVLSVRGFLDYSSGDSDFGTYNAKVQNSDHIFLCDYTSFQNLTEGWQWDPFSFLTGVITSTEQGTTVDVTSENGRMVINGTVYQILLIDDPMGMHEHLEIYLKYVGGGLGV